MHVDLCIQLGEDEMTPEELADKVDRFRKDLGDPVSFAVEVTPVSQGASFVAATTKKIAEGRTVWAPDVPADRTG